MNSLVVLVLVVLKLTPASGHAGIAVLQQLYVTPSVLLWCLGTFSCRHPRLGDILVLFLCRVDKELVEGRCGK